MESRFTPLLSLPQELMKAINKIDNYKRSCGTKLSECDQMLSDIDHVLELNRLSAVQMTKLIGKRKEILLERRFWKNEIQRCGVVAGALPHSQELHGQLTQAAERLKEYEDGIAAREYTPHILFDLFDEKDREALQARRQDLTKFGGKHTKHNLALEDKFRQL